MATSTLPANLIVFELANNHMGQIDHGLRVIREFGEVRQEFPEFNFAFKLQYRDLDTFIHPAMRGRDDIKYIKRFSETRLDRAAIDTLVAEIRRWGFLAMATPFDNASIPVILEQDLDIIKIASCSFTDWPLLEDIVKTDKPIIASTAGSSLTQIDQVVSFLSHRQKQFAILHCVGEYPTAHDKLHLSQVDLLKARYPGVRIGFSTHEDPADTDIVKLAVAKGVDLFEKHVGVATGQMALNAYSANPAQIRAWLQAARKAREICGVGDARLPVNRAEQDSLQSLRRGVFLKRQVQAGEVLTADDVYFAFPPEPGQFTANDWSKYASFEITRSGEPDEPVFHANARRKDDRDRVLSIAQRVKELIEKSRITIPGGVDLEISHHFGIDRFDEYGLTMITVVNRGYCKKLLICLPGQKHPEQYHQHKEETFHILHGDLEMTLDGVTRTCRAGDVVNVEPGVRHAFVSPTGAVIEEISSTHDPKDSFYTDERIGKQKNRKTWLTYWLG